MALVWDIFEPAAKAMASLQEVPELPIVVVSQVLVGETSTDQRSKAVTAVKEIVSAWAARQP